MRNPYRWSFDRQTGDIYVGDVGGINEEITFIPAAQARGANLGWNCFSGTAVQSGCVPVQLLPAHVPVPERPGCRDRRLHRARPGAAVVRGPVPVRPLRHRDHHEARATGGAAGRRHGLNIANVSGFGEDGVGHLYATSLAGAGLPARRERRDLTKTSIGSFTQPVSVAAAPGVTDELFIAEKPGRLIRLDAIGHQRGDRHAQHRGRQRRAGAAVGGGRARTTPPAGRLFLFYTDNGGDLQVGRSCAAASARRC